VQRTIRIVVAPVEMTLVLGWGGENNKEQRQGRDEGIDSLGGL